MVRNYTAKTGNKYILLDLIGTGGMAEVYRCKLSGQKGFEKIIVIKKLLADIAKDKEIVENFIDEARLAALLQHENIISIYDFGELDGSFFIAMEYLFGKDLHTIIQRAKETNSPMGVEQALLIAAKICEGMGYAHSLKDLHYRPLNLIHRDLSPHNIFITYDGKVKIIDFGIAKAELYDNRTKAGVVKGKLSYMSPEQLVGKDIDLRSDIFSIGILLYEMLSGKRMYSGDTATLIRKCMQVDYVELEKTAPDLPAGIYAILHRALCKDRDKRYQSCAAMGSDIDDCLFSLQKRVDGKILKDYVRHILSVEYNLEKNRLFQEDGKGYQENYSAESDLTRVDQYRPEITSFFQRTVPVDADATGVTVPFRRSDALSSSWFRYWKSMITGGVIVGMLGLILHFSGPDIGKQLEKNQQMVVQTVQPVNVSLAPKPPVEALAQAKVEPVTNPAEKGLTTVQIEVKRLLEKAQAALRSNSLMESEFHSSFSNFKKVLELDPENSTALAGISHLREHFIRSAEHALADGNFSEAAKFVDMGLVVSPENNLLLSQRDRIELQKQKWIKKLFLKAQRALGTNSLMTPADDCAYKYYQDILRIEKGNSHALNGLKVIANRYAALAEEAYRNMKIANARVFVRNGLTVDPNHRKLLELQVDLSRSKPGIFFKSIEKSLKPLWE